MSKQVHNNYQYIEKAIVYSQEHQLEQPSFDEITKNTDLSPSSFRRIFKDWSGVNPEKFLNYISIPYAKQLLGNKQTSLFGVINHTESIISGRLHNSVVKIKILNLDEYKNTKLIINYSYQETQFGEILMASTNKGVCYMGFSNERSEVFKELETRFPKSIFIHKTDEFQKNTLQIFNKNWGYSDKINLHLKGTDFQIRVWEALLKIPTGCLTTYGEIAKEIHKPKAARAVGTAIGSNPIAFLIPCHRVIQATGIFGGYMWGTTRKAAIIGWEASLNKILK